MEARLEIVLGRWAARFVAAMLFSFFFVMTLSLLTAALIAWLAGVPKWSYGFLIGASVWGGVTALAGVLGHGLLHRRMVSKEAIYRLRLAQSGMRLIEKSLAEPYTAKSLSSALTAPLGRLLWFFIRRWLRKWIPFL